MFAHKKTAFEREVEDIQSEIATIKALKATLTTSGWRQVVELFQREIASLVQSVYDKCKDPDKNSIEIRTRKMLADALGSILCALDNRVAEEEYLRKQLQEKTAEQSAMSEETF